MMSLSEIAEKDVIKKIGDLKTIIADAKAILSLSEKALFKEEELLLRIQNGKSK